MIEIRPLHKEEIEEANRLIPSACCAPDWNFCWAVLDDKEIVGLFGMETRLVVEPFYMKNGNHHAHALAAMGFVDGRMRAAAETANKTGYEFFVGDDNPKFE